MRLRIRIGTHFLQKEMHEVVRDVRSISLSGARRIGVLFTGEDEHMLNAVSTFIKELRLSGKSVRCLGYVPRPKVAETLRASQDLEFFSQDDLNWYFRPESRTVCSFLEDPFDILIDLRLRRRMPLPFMVGLSQARFKVGRFNERDRDLHDLMIRADDGMDITEYIVQIRHYLEKLDAGDTSSASL